MGASNKKKNTIDAQLDVYRDNFIKHGDSPLGTHQNDRGTQSLRFERLIKHLDFNAGEKTTIHDIGSGTCDLYEYLNGQDKQIVYSGTEIVQEMIDVASAKYPEIKLYNRNILDEKTEDTYDYVVLSGTFNIPGEVTKKNWEQFIFSIISKMFLMSSKGIAFNGLTTYKTLTNPTLYYLDPKLIFDFCATHLSRFVTIDHSYALYEYTVTVYKKEEIRNRYKEDYFAKYFK